MENVIVGRNSSKTLSLHRELSVDFAQTILEIAPMMLLPGLHEDFERGVDRFSRLLTFRSIVGSLPHRPKRAAEVVLRHRPVEWHPPTQQALAKLTMPLSQKP